MSKACRLPKADLLDMYMRLGAPIFGKVEASGLYEQEINEAELKVDELLATAVWARAGIHASMRPSGKQEVDEEVYAKTLEEVEAGKAKRPLSARKKCCLLYTSPSPRDRTRSRMPSSA